MATLSELIRERRETGQGVGQALGGSLKDKLKEKMDPRRMLNQTGILTALFPMLRSFKAGSSRDVGSSLHNKSVELLTSTTSLSVDQLGVIEKNTEMLDSEKNLQKTELFYTIFKIEDKKILKGFLKQKDE